MRQDGLRRLDGMHHSSIAVEFIDVRPVLVGHPEPAVPVEDETLRVDGDALAAGPVSAEAIPGVCCDGKRREARVGCVSGAIGIETCCGLAVWAGQEDRVQILELQVGAGGVLRRGIGRQLEGKGQLVEARLEVECSVGVPEP